MENELELKRIRNLAAVHKYQDKNREKVRESWRNYYRNTHNNWTTFIKSLGFGSCSICGYDKCFEVIDFHHTDPTLKSQSISAMKAKPFNSKNKQKLQEELKKCTPLCSNCHRELHYKWRLKKGDICGI